MHVNQLEHSILERSFTNVMTQREEIPGSAQPDSDPNLVLREDEELWTKDRLELWSWFQRNARSLGELYLGAVKMVYGPDFPGRTR
ncbi:unnamed protein product, partial [marine sediment metagenome]